MTRPGRARRPTPGESGTRPERCPPPGRPGKGDLDLDTQAGQDQVVSLGHGNLRGKERAALFLQDLDHGRVRRVGTIRLCV